MQNFVSAVLGGLVAGAVVMLFMSEAGAPPATAVSDEVGTVDQAVDLVARRRLDELDSRLRGLDVTGDLAAEPALVRAPVETFVPDGLDARVQALEDELTNLRQQVSLTTFEPAQHEDQVEIARRVLRSRVDPGQRARAYAELARGLSRAGRVTEAVAAIDAGIAEFGNTIIGEGWLMRKLAWIRKDLSTPR